MIFKNNKKDIINKKRSSRNYTNIEKYRVVAHKIFQDIILKQNFIYYVKIKLKSRILYMDGHPYVFRLE